VGLEASCRVRFRGATHEGTAHLDSTELQFTGGIRFVIPFKDVTSVQATRGRLGVDWPEGPAVLDLGKDAEKWALKIKYPRGLLDKLGIKPGARVAVMGVEDPAFDAQLAERTADVSRSKPRRDTDLAVVFMDKTKDLAKLKSIRASIKPDGSIWVVWPKGKAAFREDDVRSAGPRLGLVDVKVVSFSPTLSGLKMVIPVRKRPKKR
jgi:hypothetical protein